MRGPPREGAAARAARRRAAGFLLLPVAVVLPDVAAAQSLADYAAYAAERNQVTITSTTGQRLRLTAYGSDVVRVQAVRAQETFFGDDRYGMVSPDAPARLGGTLEVRDAGARLEVQTPAADGIRVVVEKAPLRLAVQDKGRGTPLLAEGPDTGVAWEGADHRVVKQRFAPPAPGERFIKAGHGFYGRSPRLDRTGDVVSHNYGRATAGADQAPAIVPFYLSSRGYGVFFNTTFDTTFSFGAGGRYEFWAAAGAATGARPQLDYFVIDGPRFADVLDRYTQLTGRPRLPQRSIFGLQLSDKNFPSVSSQEWWRAKITEHRAAGFPLDHHVNDNRWRAGSGAWSGSWFEFSRERWPDPAAYRQWADHHGITVTLDYNRNNSPLMAGWHPGHGFAPADVTGVSYSDAVPDWSDPAARRWVWDVFYSQALDPRLGFPGDGLWLDETDELGPIPDDAATADGRRWAEMRNAYFLLLLKAVGQEGWDPDAWGHIGRRKRPWIWTRGATAGMQRHGHYWTGDIESTYAEMRMQIRGMQAAGLGGFPYANIDGGGFHAGPGDGLISEAFYRNWPAAWSSFSPIWRPHSGADTAVLGRRASRWPLDQGPAAQAEFKRYGLLRYTLMPYVYTLAHEASATGMPMARAMVIAYQDRRKAYDHDLQYLWGPSILVAPPTDDGGGAQDVWLPAGDTWYDFWSDSKHAGSDAVDLRRTTRTGELGLFVKAGAILPRHPYAQSTAFLDETRLELDVYTGADGRFTVYEDDGVTEAFRATGEHRRTTVRYVDAARRVTVEHPSGTYAGAPAGRRYVVRLHGLAAPVGMRVAGGATLPAFTSEAAAFRHGSGSVWDARSRVLSVVTGPVAVRPGGGVALTVEPSGAPFPAVRPGTVFEAEDARLSGAVIDTRHAGSTGTGFADFADASAQGASVAWTVDVPASGSYALVFRYANGADGARPLDISVDGTTISRPAFAPTGAWDSWTSATVAADLPAGRVEIRATTVGANGPNLDGVLLR